MKTNFNPEAEATLTYVPSFQTTPFVITGLGETLQDIASTIESTASTPRQTNVQAPQPVSEPTEQYLNLRALEPRQEARMALKALAWDIKTLGRNNEYRRFKQRVAEEKALAMDMELGLVQRVHCRLHERLLKG